MTKYRAEIRANNMYANYEFPVTFTTNLTSSEALRAKAISIAKGSIGTGLVFKVLSLEKV